MKHLKNYLSLKCMSALCSLALMLSVYAVDHPCLFFLHQPKFSEELKAKIKAL